MTRCQRAMTGCRRDGRGGCLFPTSVEQLFVVVNLERTERRLASLVVLSKSLTAVAQAGARAGRDPAMKSVPQRRLARLLHIR